MHLEGKFILLKDRLSSKLSETGQDAAVGSLNDSDQEIFALKDKNNLHKFILRIAGSLILALLGIIGYFGVTTINDFKKLFSDNATKISNIENKIKSLEIKDIEIDDRVSRYGSSLVSLSGNTFHGKIVFFQDNTTNKQEQFFCSLSLNYPWAGLEGKALRRYKGKYVLLSFDGLNNNSHKFKITGFFPGRDTEGRMVQIPYQCLEFIMGQNRAKRLREKGVFDGMIYFPTEK